MTTPQYQVHAAQLIQQRRMTFGGLRVGKTFAALQGLEQAARRTGQSLAFLTRQLNGMRPTLIVLDEFSGPLRAEEFRHLVLAKIADTERDRANYHRGGRYRKPPAAKSAKPPEPGMVQVRNRRGQLEWKKLGKGAIAGTEAARMRESPLWGQF